jgi:class 3 adenylate cyclase/CHASE2 domain-containing sensor protein
MARLRDLAIAAAIAVVVGAALASPAADRLAGLGIDALVWLRHQVYGAAGAPGAKPIAVIAIDEETFRRAPFRHAPKVLHATLAAGAKVVGFDLIFPNSVERFVPGFDREFLLALRRGGRTGRVVLAKVQHQAQPIVPFPGHVLAVGGSRNVRAANAFADDDGVVRRMPLWFRRAGAEGREPSLALELAARAAGVAPRIAGDGDVMFKNGRIPGRIVLDFEGGAGGIPTYSLADLHACAEQGNLDYFRRAFQGKVVLIGTVLDVEDRKLTSKRLATSPDGAAFAERCTLPVMQGLARDGLARDTIPGVYVHATAVRNLLEGTGLRELDRWTRALAILGLTLAAALMVMALAPVRSGMALVAGAVIWAGAATVYFRAGVVLPLFEPIAAAAASFALLSAYRYSITDRDKRHIRRLFSYYLSPAVIEQLIDQNELPHLGGETREVTILFSDVTGFMGLAEGMSAADVTRLLNEYLSAMSDVIEDHGGYIEKFVADEITGVFGAPIDDPDHARSAVEAALACGARLEELQAELDLPPGRALEARTGINSGRMLVGNIGSRRRFTYAAMGDAANLGSRLEGANKAYGTRILVGPRTHELTRGMIAYREIDLVRVAGRSEPVRVFEPLGLKREVPSATLDAARSFAEALAFYREGKFDAAAEAFAALPNDDPVARVFVHRASTFAAAPPADWDGVHALERK